MKENGFTLKKTISKRYPAETITDADYADDIAVLANTPTQAESLLHSLKRAAGSIGLHMDADKTDYMCFNQKGGISTLNCGSLKLVDNFTYLGSSVPSTEDKINIRLVKAWTDINRFLPSSGCVNSTVWMHHMDADETYREKARRELHKNAMSYIEQILEATSHETTVVRPPTSYL